jgi:hypothetical protein
LSRQLGDASSARCTASLLDPRKSDMVCQVLSEVVELWMAAHSGLRTRL